MIELNFNSKYQGLFDGSFAKILAIFRLANFDKQTNEQQIEFTNLGLFQMGNILTNLRAVSCCAEAATEASVDNPAFQEQREGEGVSRWRKETGVTVETPNNLMD